jgi:prepilin-type N-terminal cleavage/methylation domain-containing protein
MQGSQTTPNSAPGSAGGSPLAGRGHCAATPGQSPGLTVPSDLQSPASSLQPRTRRPRRAFTLTELLVVIAIIGVLASLITAAAMNALRNAKRARIVLEIKQMATATENFKNDNGAYPPNGMNDGSNAMIERLASDFARTMKRAFPRMHPNEEKLIRAMAGQTQAPNPTFNMTSGPLQNGLSGAEAVYFWLGGFSQDPQFPISGPGGPSFDIDSGDEVMEDRARRYEFDLGRLGPRDDDGLFHDTDNSGTGRFITYRIDLNGDGQADDAGETQRRINLWRYQPSGSEQPFVYFDCSRYKPYQYDMSASPTVDIYPFKAVREGRAQAMADKDIIFKESPKFQLLHCGLDEAWGDFTPMSYQANNYGVITFPEGPITGELADTLTNFTNGDVADELEE